MHSCPPVNLQSHAQYTFCMHTVTVYCYTCVAPIADDSELPASRRSRDCGLLQGTPRARLYQSICGSRNHKAVSEAVSAAVCQHAESVRQAAVYDAISADGVRATAVNVAGNIGCALDVIPTQPIFRPYTYVLGFIQACNIYLCTCLCVNIHNTGSRRRSG